MNVFSLPFPDCVGSALGWMVVHSVWQATAIAVVTGVVLIGLRHKSAAMRYWVAVGALGCVLACAAATFGIYYQQAPTPEVVLTGTMLADKSSSNASFESLTRSVGEQQTPKPLSLSTLIDYTEQNLPLIVAIWFLGVTFFLLRLLGGISYIYYLRGRMNFPPDEYWTSLLYKIANRTKIGQGIELVESALVRSPMTLGHIKPIILFPIGILNRLSESEVEAILAHELAHIIRRDYLFNLLQSVVEAMFYYHPAVWWLSAQVRNERESACDETAIALTGDKMGYARALVTVQEMAYFPLSPALGFAGQGKSQFLVRMQRILHQSTIQKNVMEKLVATLLIIGSVVALLLAQNSAITSNKISSSVGFTDEAALDVPMSGVWQSEETLEGLCFTFSNRNNGNVWGNSLCLKEDKPTIPATDGTFKIIREAGTMELTGRKDGAEGYGKFKFLPNSEFKTYLISERGMKAAPDGLLMHCFFADINRAYFALLENNGHKTVSEQELQDLAIFRIEPSMIAASNQLYAKAGEAAPSLGDITQLKIHNVDAAFANSLEKVGFFNLSPDELMQLKIHNIDAAFISEFRKLGFQDITPDDLMQLRIHGIDSKYVTEMNAKRNKKLSVDELVSSKIHNVANIDERALAEAGYGDLSQGELEAFAIHGIDPKYIDEMLKTVGRLTKEELIAFKIHSIKGDYATEVKEAGVSIERPSDLLNMTIHGVDVVDIRRFKAAGMTNMTGAELIDAAIFGTTPETVAEARKKGMKSTKLGDYTQHNVGFEALSANARQLEQQAKLMTEQYVRDAESYSRASEADIRASEADIRASEAKMRASEAEMRKSEAKMRLSEAEMRLSEAEMRLSEAEMNKSEEERDHLMVFISSAIDDGLIPIGKKCKFSFDENSMEINGKDIGAERYERYKKAVIKKRGKPMPRSFNIKFNGVVKAVTEDGLEMEGQFHTDVTED